MGGKAQTNPDPALQKSSAAVPGLTSPGPVVALALELEQGAAETYVADVAALSDADAKKVTASIMGVEAQHASVLLAVQALLNANAAQFDHPGARQRGHSARRRRIRRVSRRVLPHRSGPPGH